MARDGSEAAIVRGAPAALALAQEAIASGRGLAQVIAAHGLGEAVDLARLLDEGRVTLPVTHSDPSHMHLTGTGLTHLGNASARDAMHAKLAAGAETLTDSTRMFRMGREGGGPDPGAVGVMTSKGKVRSGASGGGRKGFKAMEPLAVPDVPAAEVKLPLVRPSGP